VPVGTVVFERRRLQGKIVNEARQPVQLSASWFVQDVIQRVPQIREADTGPGGIRSRMEEAGYEMHYEDVVTSRGPDGAEQEQLEIDERQSVLDVWRTCFDQTDAVIEVSRRVINPLLHELTYRY
jgi:GntR family transcriptional regulator